MPSPQRKKGRPWRRAAKRVRRQATICELCGQPIDKDLPWPHPMSFSVDHTVSIAAGGDEYDPRNLRPSHLRCNQTRGDGRRDAPRVPSSRAW